MSDLCPPLKLLVGGAREPQPNVVAMLRDYLERAERGEVVAAALAVEYADGDGAYWAAHGSHTRPSTLVANLQACSAAIVDRHMRTRET